MNPNSLTGLSSVSSGKAVNTALRESASSVASEGHLNFSDIVAINLFNNLSCTGQRDSRDVPATPT